ncbi:FAD-dependent oxidoreductase [Sinomonas susongensis]|uniref:FAD-dependent oxidoreductase n=1 Tax=Sinomonas susongensis TaxID=1324851 RepID=UPI0011098BB8|nr:NAD(P)/FAD-dependent oxidoreductase [Sinomonas susongensis]
MTPDTPDRATADGSASTRADTAFHEVVIVGGGPVGLCLGVLLARRGIDVVVLEARPERTRHSRAIGIHPPARRVLAAAGVVETLAARGVELSEGRARFRGEDVARLDFDPPVLAVPQWITEQTLEARLLELAPRALRRGVRAVGVERRGSGAVVRAVSGGAEVRVAGRWVVAADGARSPLRGALGIPVLERRYPDAYLMGDFADTTADGTAAVLHLECGGIVESFPLPGGVRRWVVHTDALEADATPARLARLVQERTGAVVDPASSTMLSAFTVHERLADSMLRGRVVLIGDAAHEVSPIGGQGMTLGWLDAEAFAPLLADDVLAARYGFGSDGATVWPALWARVADGRRRAAAQAARHAGLNMALGRPLAPRLMSVRNAAFRGLYRTSAVRSWTSRRFTMQ